MNKNEYRRAFIMLRAAIQGYGGHARLERRTLTGSLCFIVTAPQGAGPLIAALAGQRGNEYFVAPIGRLAPDRRGQLTLAWQFDPRSIDGRPLEAYAWVTVVRDSDFAVALTGNVDGHRPMDMASLTRAIRATLSAPDEPAADLPDVPPASQPTVEPTVEPPTEAPRVAAPVEAPDVQAEAPAAPVEAPAAGEVPESEDDAPRQGDVKVYTRMRSRRRLSRAREASTPPAAPAAEPATQAEPAPQAAPAKARTAAAALGLGISAPWPGDAEPLRRLFATQKPLETPLGDGYVYVSAPSPRPGARADAVIGLKADGGAITGVRYAVAGVYAPEPPVGLDGYEWRATDGGAGYWVLDVAATP